MACGGGSRKSLLLQRKQDSTGKESIAPCQKDRGLAPVGDPFYTCHTRAVGAAVEVVLCLDAVSYHLDAAVLAGWRERVDGTLEAVEGARTLAGHAYLKTLVILISTNFALGHNRLLLLAQAGRSSISGMSTLPIAETNARLTDLPLMRSLDSGSYVWYVLP